MGVPVKMHLQSATAEEKRREEKFVVGELPLSSLMYGKCQYMLTVVLIWRYI